MTSPHLGQQLQEAERLPMGLRQRGDGAAPGARAPEQHALAAQAPHGAAAGVHAAGLPAGGASFPDDQGLPAQREDVAPVHPQHPTRHPAESS